MDLRERCKQFYQELNRNAMLRQGSPVDDIMAFVIAEKGRAADASLEDTLPLCLYFGSADDRNDFMAVVGEVKPNMVMKKTP